MRRGLFQIYRASSTSKGRKQTWAWRLRSANGKILADSGERYTNFSDCVRAIKRIKSIAAQADVFDLTMPNRFPPGYFD